MRNINVFWDMITCPPSTRDHPSLVAEGIRHALKDFGIIGPVFVFAYAIRQKISNEIETEINRAGISMYWLHENEQPKGVLSFMHKIIALKFHHRKLEESSSQPPTKAICMVISRNERFAGLLHKIKWQGDYQTFLVHPHNQPRNLSDSCLVCSCDHVWSFAGLLNRAGPC